MINKEYTLVYNGVYKSGDLLFIYKGLDKGPKKDPDIHELFYITSSVERLTKVTSKQLMSMTFNYITTVKNDNFQAVKVLYGPN